jgi:hypothetical protein
MRKGQHPAPNKSQYPAADPIHWTHWRHLFGARQDLRSIEHPRLPAGHPSPACPRAAQWNAKIAAAVAILDRGWGRPSTL